MVNRHIFISLLSAGTLFTVAIEFSRSGYMQRGDWLSVFIGCVGLIYGLNSLGGVPLIHIEEKKKNAKGDD